MKLNVVAVVLLSLLASGASAAPVERGSFETPYGVELNASAGEVVFVEGSYESAWTVTIGNDVSSTMPGAGGIPFAFKVKAGTYRQTTVGEGSDRFCAPLDRASASFPMLGSVVADGDCIGLDRQKGTGGLRWIVDNSNHNGFTTIWSRPVKASELANLSFVETQVVAASRVERAIYFDGFYGGLLVFTFQDGANKREMKFDYDGKSPKLIGMLGKRMRVLSADSVELRYEWVAPDN